MTLTFCSVMPIFPSLASSVSVLFGLFPSVMTSVEAAEPCFYFPRSPGAGSGAFYGPWTWNPAPPKLLRKANTRRSPAESASRANVQLLSATVTALAFRKLCKSRSVKAEQPEDIRGKTRKHFLSEIRSSFTKTADSWCCSLKIHSAEWRQRHRSPLHNSLRHQNSL